MRLNILGLLAVGFLAAVMQPARATPYSSIYVFGDSLSDGGNAYVLSAGSIPPSPPYAGRFSNGPTAVERMAADFGVALTPSIPGGTNFAIGGAATGQVPIPTGGSTSNYLFPDMGIDAEVSLFLLSAPAFDPATALFVVWGGLSDLQINRSPAVAAQAVERLANYVKVLYDNGARNFLVPNMLDLSVTPVGRSQAPADQAALHSLTLAFNATLEQAMNQLALLPAMNLMQFDTFGFFNAVIANPAAYGLTNVTEPCFDGVAVCSQPEEYLFWDGGHPTARGHQLLGQGFASAVTPPDPSALLQQLLTDVAGVGPGASLANKVALAQAYYAVPDIQATCAVLADFVSQVSGLTSGRKPRLSTELASGLTADAEVIMTAIGCN